jgi:hypothetical protein
MSRPLCATILAGLFVLVVAGPVSAGGWADIQVDATTTTDPPIAGEATTIGFTVLQHGVTPAGWVHPTVRFEPLLGTGALEAVALPEGPDGHFAVDVTLPSSGYWSWSVSLPELVVDAAPVTIGVAAADGRVPVLDEAAILTALARVKVDAVREASDQLRPDLERADSLITVQRQQLASLQDQVDTLLAAEGAQAGAATAPDAAPTATTGTAPSETPWFGIVLLAVLAGATAGFAMSWLGRASGPNVGQIGTPGSAEVSRSPEGSPLG